MSTIVLRPPVAEDVAAVTAIFSMPEVQRWTLRLPFMGEALVRRRITEPGPQTYHVLGEIDGHAAGFGTLLRHDGRRSHVGDVAVLVVHDRMARRGVGRAVLSALVDLADKWLGLRRLALNVDTRNARALALYTRFGFEIEGTLRGDVITDGVLSDSHLMARLRPAPAFAEGPTP